VLLTKKRGRSGNDDSERQVLIALKNNVGFEFAEELKLELLGGFYTSPCNVDNSFLYSVQFWH